MLLVAEWPLYNCSYWQLWWVVCLQQLQTITLSAILDLLTQHKLQIMWSFVLNFPISWSLECSKIFSTNLPYEWWCFLKVMRGCHIDHIYYLKITDLWNLLKFLNISTFFLGWFCPRHHLSWFICDHFSCAIHHHLRWATCRNGKVNVSWRK